MDEDQRGNLLSATFPAPPPFYKYFTPENQARLNVAKGQAAAETTNVDELDLDRNRHEADVTELLPHLSDLPRELLYLIPPEPPSTGVYRSFGETIDVSAG